MCLWFERDVFVVLWFGELWDSSFLVVLVFVNLLMVYEMFSFDVVVYWDNFIEFVLKGL